MWNWVADTNDFCIGDPISCLSCEIACRRFQPGKRPRDILCDYETSNLRGGSSLALIEIHSNNNTDNNSSGGADAAPLPGLRLPLLPGLLVLLLAVCNFKIFLFAA